MRIKICGLFRDEDIDYVNEARPDYVGFVFAESKRKVSAPLAQHLRFRLASGIIPVGVFVNAPINDVAALYHNGTISIAQLHGNEDESYINQLKKKCEVNVKPGELNVIKAVKIGELEKKIILPANADYYLVDSGAGSGKSFDWKLLKKFKLKKPWFLAGGISIKNIDEAIALNPFAIDISSGAETKGIKNRKKILELVAAAKGNS